MRQPLLTTLGDVTSKGVKAAGRSALVGYVAAIAENGHGLVSDAELLFGCGRWARAYTVAALASEEFGKAAGVLALVLMPDDIRAQMPVRDLLEWHRLKQVGGLLMAVVQAGTPGIAARIAATPADQLAVILEETAAQADESDQWKKRGLYVDMDDYGQIQRPADITEAEAAEGLARAREVAASAGLLTDPAAHALFSNPSPQALAFSSELFSAYFAAADLAGPEDAAMAALDIASRVQTHIDAQGTTTATAE
jgi:AbiV family abortive infection protein